MTKNISKNHITTKKEHKNKVKSHNKYNHSNKNKMFNRLERIIPLSSNPLFVLSILGILSVILLALFVASMNKDLQDIQLNDPGIINGYNRNHNDYSIRFNSFFQGMSLKDVTEMFKSSLINKKPECSTFKLTEVIVPESYNFYEQHPECKFAEIQHRSTTGYIETIMSVFRNRYCLHKLGSDFEPSFQYVLECDKENEYSADRNINKALNFMKYEGFISQQCWFTSKHTYDRDICPYETEIKKCSNYQLDDYCFLNSIMTIKQEIFSNGPVIGVMDVYQNFLLYEKGVYNFDESRKLEGSLLVKIIGWGRESKESEYWLVESSWGPIWGNNGIAKVRMNVVGSTLDNLALTLYPKIDES